MKKLIKFIFVIAVIIILGAGGVLYGLDYLNLDLAETKTLYVNEAEYSLPQLRLSVEGQQLNYLAGYSKKMTASNLRQSIVPLSGKRQMTVWVKDNVNKIQKIAWRVYDLNQTQLLEEEEAVDWEEGAKEGEVTIQYSPLVLQGEEYNVELILTLENGREVYYYTRILLENTEVWTQLTFAKNFMESTFDKSAAADLIVPYMQATTDSSSDLSHATLASPFRKLTWSDWAPVQSTEVVVTVTELYSNQSTILFDYEVKANDTAYQVRECYSMRTLDNQIYLMDFQRDITEEMDKEKLTASSKKMRMGVGHERFDVVVSSDNQYGALLSGDYLWAYDSKKSEMSLIYELSDDSEISSSLEEADILLSQVDDEGNVYFLVAGYITRGTHSGVTGIIAYEYEKLTHSLRELFYIQVDTSGEILNYLMGEHCYLQGEKYCYFVYDSDIYQVDMEQNTMVSIVQIGSQDYIKMSKDGSLMAWTDELDAAVIHTINFKTCTMNEITAGEGECLRLENFLDDGVVYTKSIMKDNQEPKRLQYALEIANIDGEVYTHYEKNESYISNIQVSDTTVTFDLSELIGEELVSSGQDAIIASQTESKQKEVFLVNGSSESYVDLSAWSGNKISWETTEAPLQVSENNQLEIQLLDRQKLYYAYAAGRLYGISSTPGDLINSVYNVLGIVVDGNQQIVWARRSRSLYVTLNVSVRMAEDNNSLKTCLEILLEQGGFDSSVVKGKLEKQETPYQILQEAFEEKALDVTGASLVSCYYYMNLGTPIIIQTGARTAVLVTAFTTSTAVIYDPLTGESQTISTDEAEAYAQNSIGMYTYLK
ncbi:MAG: hypothetical protein ACI4C1_01755 [Lachnospiraceae bacterium]